VIAAVNRTHAPSWPTGWEDVEVVDSVLVTEDAEAARPCGAEPVAASRYDGSGRVALEGRFGRLVSVLA
jgi:hypothetical protein